MVDALFVSIRSVQPYYSWLALENDFGAVGGFSETGDCVNAIFVSYAANLVLPRVGEISRCGVLAKYDDISFTKSLGTVVTERLVDVVCMVFITGTTFCCKCLCFFPFLKRPEQRFRLLCIC